MATAAATEALVRYGASYLREAVSKTGKPARSGSGTAIAAPARKAAGASDAVVAP